jgi:hypothetical protein
MNLKVVLVTMAIVYFTYNTFKKHQKDSKYQFCPMCNRFEEAIDQYGHCSQICCSITMDGPYEA